MLIPIVLVRSTISAILFLCRTMHKDCELIPLSGLAALSVTLVNVCTETCLKGSRHCERQVPEFKLKEEVSRSPHSLISVRISCRAEFVRKNESRPH